MAERVATLSEEHRIDGHAEDLVPLTGIAVSEAGVLAIIQRQDAQVRFYSAEGEFLGTFGGRGEGPGEFIAPAGPGWRGDTLWVRDNALRRISFISPSLELIRVESNFPRSARPDQGDGTPSEVMLRVTPYGPGPDGLFLADVVSTGPPHPAPFTDYGTLAHVDRGGTIRRVILPLHSDEAPGPIRNQPEFTFASQIGRAAVATASLTGPDAGTFSLVSVDFEGDTLFARRYAFEPEEIPRRVADSLLAHSSEEWSRSMNAAMGERWPGGDVPPIYPPLRRLLIGEDGSFWIRMRLRDRQSPWFVLAADGEPVGTVLLPQGSRVGAATLERIWVVEEDPQGVESLVRYRVQWE